MNHIKQFLEQVHKIITANYGDENFGVEQLAQQMRMSRIQLYRKYKAATGKPVSDAIRSYRMKRAQELLANGKYAVGEAAMECGFGNLKHFSTAFKKHFGYPPGSLLKARPP